RRALAADLAHETFPFEPRLDPAAARPEIRAFELRKRKRQARALERPSARAELTAHRGEHEIAQVRSRRVDADGQADAPRVVEAKGDALAVRQARAAAKSVAEAGDARGE